MRKGNRKRNVGYGTGTYEQVLNSDQDPYIDEASSEQQGSHQKQNSIVGESINYFKEPFTQEKFFSVTDSWFLTGNTILAAGYSSLFIARFLNNSTFSLSFLNMYFFGWNYFDFVARIFMHICNITEIIRNRRDVKKQLLLESVNILATLALAGGNTLSLLTQLGLITASTLVLTIFGSLANFTTSFCAVVISFIELYKSYKAYRMTNLSVLLRDRLKRFARLQRVLEEDAKKIKKLKEYEKKAIVDECKALKEQSIAIARVYYSESINEQQKLNRKSEIQRFLNTEEVKDEKLTIDNLQINPTENDIKVCKYIVKRQLVLGRNHGFNAAFWLLVGAGLTLSTLASFFFPPLLIPAIVVIGAAVAVKAADVLELDKRLYNSFLKKEKKSVVKNNPHLGFVKTGSTKQSLGGNNPYRCFDRKEEKTIENRNPLTNYLARRKKEKEIEKNYDDAYEGINTLLGRKKNNKISKAVCVRMKIAFELSMTDGYRGRFTGEEFYKEFLKLPWLKRQKYLDRAMERKLEKEAFLDKNFIFLDERIPQKDKAACVEEWYCRDFHLFGKPKSSKYTANPLTEGLLAKKTS